MEKSNDNFPSYYNPPTHHTSPTANSSSTPPYMPFFTPTQLQVENAEVLLRLNHGTFNNHSLIPRHEPLVTTNDPFSTANFTGLRQNISGSYGTSSNMLNTMHYDGFYGIPSNPHSYVTNDAVQRNSGSNNVKSINETQQSNLNVGTSKNVSKGRKKKKKGQVNVNEQSSKKDRSKKDNKKEKQKKGNNTVNNAKKKKQSKKLKREALKREALAQDTWRTPKKSEKPWLIQDPNLVIKEHFQKAEVIVFGSVNTGLYLPTSDIDIACFIHAEPKSAIYAIAKLFETLNISADKSTMITLAELHPKIQSGKIVPDDENLGVLLIEFFELYGVDFNYEQLAIRVERDDDLGMGIGYCKKENEPWATKCPEKLCIQDPIQKSKDTTIMPKIRGYFERAFNTLVNRVCVFERSLSRNGDIIVDLHKQSILSSILFIRREIINRRRKLHNDFRNGKQLGQAVAPFGTGIANSLRLPDLEYIRREFCEEIGDISMNKERAIHVASSNNQLNGPGFLQAKVNLQINRSNSDMDLSDPGSPPINNMYGQSVDPSNNDGPNKGCGVQ
ncbi:1648_t:CDS:2 [Racocetra fulgida]|uniref:1648_t:CDS:1 n=1 Tax=Racocetra fulgida TaxID=60492 RepID=A0A9N9F392_9GLOM|nr:1648_t:CDS:2 [Racocetra fulgida]